MNISRAVLMFYTFLLFLKLPSTVLNAHLTLIETLCGLDSRYHYSLGFLLLQALPTLLSQSNSNYTHQLYSDFSFFISITSYYIYMSIFLLNQVL